MNVQAAQDTTTTVAQTNLPGVASSDIEALFSSQLAMAQSLTGRSDLLSESGQPQTDDSTKFQQALALQNLNYQASVAMMQHNMSGVVAVQTMMNMQLNSWGFGEQAAKATQSQTDTAATTQKTATTAKKTTTKTTTKTAAKKAAATSDVTSTSDAEAASNAGTSSSSTTSLSQEAASNASSSSSASSSLTDTLLSNASTTSSSTALSGESESSGSADNQSDETQAQAAAEESAATGQTDTSAQTTSARAELDRLIEQVGQSMGTLVQNAMLNALQAALQSMTANGLGASTTDAA